MRAWFSVPIVRGIRTGISVNANPAAQTYRVSPIGAKVWYTGSTLLLAGLAIWLFATADEAGRINEWFWLMIALVLTVRYLFKLAIVALFPPIETPR